MNLRVNENGQIVELTKTKYSTYDVYVGITQNSLLITQCEENKYAYGINPLGIFRRRNS